MSITILVADLIAMVVLRVSLCRSIAPLSAAHLPGSLMDTKKGADENELDIRVAEEESIPEADPDSSTAFFPSIHSLAKQRHC